jgi:aspartokinase/homoserine dehydrogenase 1
LELGKSIGFKMKVLKFGGTSVGTVESIRQVVRIIEEQAAVDNDLIIVVSAFAGVTNSLIRLGELAQNGDAGYQNLLNQLKNRHLEVVQHLLESTKQERVTQFLDVTFKELVEVLQGVFLLKELTLRSADLIMSFGERLSTYIIAQYAGQCGLAAEYLDTRSLIITNDEYGNALIDRVVSNQNIRRCHKTHPGVKIVTGFIASNPDQITTTLGRGGSDLTASIFGAALNATEVQIWTDVNGIMSTDPNKVPEAFSLDTVSYEEAMELSHFGAKIIYPPTIQPVLEQNIPVRIMNTFKPDFKGTLIQKEPQASRYIAKGITTIDRISLLTVQGSGLIGVTGIAARLFGALAVARINIILISQASSEHSICIAVKPEVAQLAKKQIEKEFALEMKVRQADEVIVEDDLSILAIVGEKMRHTPGISGRLFSALGDKRINVVAIAQGSSELNISVVVARKDEVRALRAVHEAFFASRSVLSLFIIGVGRIGSALIDQIRDNYQSLQENERLELRVLGIANSRQMLIDPVGINLENWQKKLQDSDNISEIKTILQLIQSADLNNCVVVDCTASHTISQSYHDFIQARASVVAANKHATTEDYQYYQELHELAQENNVFFLYETNVGAGLPILSTLHDLLNSGDKIIKIEAILSGTISYIFNALSEDTPFSEVVRQAWEKGFTEPDPRIDLEGTDFARKLLLLVREIGEKIELSDIVLENILPESCLQVESISDFFVRLQKQDSYFDRIIAKAQSEGKVLRYIASYENGKASIRLQKVAATHPFYHLKGSDNVIAFTTQRYNESPLIIKGAGAGAEVTAAGVMADIFKIANSVIKKRFV